MKGNWKSNFFYYMNKVIIALFCLSIVFPFISLFFTSLSASATASLGSFDIDWQNLTLENYESMMNNHFIWSGYANTLFRTIVGTVLSILMTSVGAYCMSRTYFPHRTFWMGFLVFTMYFGGGLIPTYLVYCAYGLKDSLWVMILPSLVGTYNLVIIRNFFQQVPASLEESARIDGAGDLRILFSIMYPISKPVLVTVAMWVAVGHWNSWYDCLVYIRDTGKFVVQVVLRRIVLQGTIEMMEAGAEDIVGNPDGLKAAAIFVTTIPILCVYPFIQKYFVKGVMVGSLKG